MQMCNFRNKKSVVHLLQTTEPKLKKRKEKNDEEQS
jgi:hypothetical protein